jgi:hypothetical protein
MPIYWMQSPVLAVALILKYFLAIWCSGVLHCYNYISATTYSTRSKVLDRYFPDPALLPLTPQL